MFVRVRITDLRFKNWNYTKKNSNTASTRFKKGMVAGSHTKDVIDYDSFFKALCPLL